MLLGGGLRSPSAFLVGLCQEVYVFAGVYLFVCLFVCFSVCNITQNVMDQF